MGNPIMLHVLCRTEHLLVSKGKLKSHKGQICSECVLPQDRGKKKRQLLIFKFQYLAAFRVKRSVLQMCTGSVNCLDICREMGGVVGCRIGLVWGVDQWDENGHGPV